MPKKKAKPAAKRGRPIINPSKDSHRTMVRHDADEEALWDRAAELTSLQLGVNVTRGPWLRLIANRAAKALVEAQRAQDVASFQSPPQATDIVRSTATKAFAGATDYEIGIAAQAQETHYPHAPRPLRNPDGTLKNAPPQASAPKKPPSPRALAALVAGAEAGEIEDAGALPELRSLGLVDGQNMPTDAAMEYLLK